MRVKRGCATLDDLKAWVQKQKPKMAENESSICPRWIRINNVSTTFERELQTTFSKFHRVDSLEDLGRNIMQDDFAPRLQDTNPSKRRKQAVPQHYYLDPHIPDLVAVPQGTDLIALRAYQEGRIIVQDKASCFPAYLLLGEQSSTWQGQIIDGCAAPGNKTTHLASLLSSSPLAKASEKPHKHHRWILSLDSSMVRSKTLQKMVHVAGADSLVSILPGQDFLALNPMDEKLSGVTALLLDPSCSGSGIQGRDDIPELTLPVANGNRGKSSHANGKKRKRDNGTKDSKETSVNPSTPSVDTSVDPTSENDIITPSNDRDRLVKLSNLQSHIVEHAMRFPSAQRLTYSTCSINTLENEYVVHRVLNSAVAKKGGWRVLTRDEQVAGLKQWPIRGTSAENDAEEIDPNWSLSNEQLEACLRCYQGDGQGTGGFFVVGFVRDINISGDDMMAKDASRTSDEEDGDDDEGEWEGFASD